MCNTYYLEHDVGEDGQRKRNPNITQAELDRRWEERRKRQQDKLKRRGLFDDPPKKGRNLWRIRPRTLGVILINDNGTIGVRIADGLDERLHTALVLHRLTRHALHAKNKCRASASLQCEQHPGSSIGTVAILGAMLPLADTGPDAALSGLAVVFILLLVLLYSIPAITLLRKGHVSGGVICFILAMLLLLAAIGGFMLPASEYRGGGEQWFFYGGGFMWTLLLIWAAGAPDLKYRRAQQHVVDELRNQVRWIERRLGGVVALEQRVGSLEQYSAQTTSDMIDGTPHPYSPEVVPTPAAIGQDEPTPVMPMEPVEESPERRNVAPASPAADDPDATPLAPQTPVEGDVPVEVKVRCRKCRKKFSGLARSINALAACPRCKASPFEFESLSQ
ncbi:MAG: hypothetical protein KDB90_04575 [Planctomycetes bacterium]|nr:hypothetical protein [Planctomycetota bacterium]